MTQTPHADRGLLHPRSGGALVAGAGLVALLVGLLATLLGFTLGSPSAGWGALVGAGAATGIFAFGTATVHLISQVMPSASLLVALLTYTLQLVLILLVLFGLERAGLAGDELDRGWLGGTLIAVTLAWLGGQLVLFTRARIPAFEAGAR